MRGISSQRHATRKSDDLPQSQSHYWRWLLLVSLVVLLLSIMLWGWQKMSDPQFLPITSVKIQGNYARLNHKVLQETILPFANKGFLALDVEGLRESIEQLPWVARASVSRIWPDTLEINILQQEPIARWGTNDLMNTEGQLFRPSQDSFPHGLPQLDGPDGEQNIVLQNYKEMDALLTPIALKISLLSLAPRHSWQLQLSNGLTLILGRDNPSERLLRFVKVYRQIFADQDKMADYIDLRYGHGMAVHWKNNKV